MIGVKNTNNFLILAAWLSRNQLRKVFDKTSDSSGEERHAKYLCKLYKNVLHCKTNVGC